MLNQSRFVRLAIGFLFALVGDSPVWAAAGLDPAYSYLYERANYVVSDQGNRSGNVFFDRNFRSTSDDFAYTPRLTDQWSNDTVYAFGNTSVFAAVEFKGIVSPQRGILGLGAGGITYTQSIIPLLPHVCCADIFGFNYGSSAMLTSAGFHDALFLNVPGVAQGEVHFYNLSWTLQGNDPGFRTLFSAGVSSLYLDSNLELQTNGTHATLGLTLGGFAGRGFRDLQSNFSPDASFDPNRPDYLHPYDPIGTGQCSYDYWATLVAGQVPYPNCWPGTETWHIVIAGIGPNPVFNIYENLEVDGFADMYDTATFSIEGLPAGATYTSLSGVFLTELPQNNNGAVPEPASVALLGLGLASLVFARWRNGVGSPGRS